MQKKVNFELRRNIITQLAHCLSIGFKRSAEAKASFEKAPYFFLGFLNTEFNKIVAEKLKPSEHIGSSEITNKELQEIQTLIANDDFPLHLTG